MRGFNKVQMKEKTSILMNCPAFKDLSTIKKKKLKHTGKKEVIEFETYITELLLYHIQDIAEVTNCLFSVAGMTKHLVTEHQLPQCFIN